MFKVELGAYVVTGLFGLLTAAASTRGCDAHDDPGGLSLHRGAKQRLLDEADLWRVHNEVYAQVGDKEWESRVKPGFLQAITWRTIRDTGKLAPAEDDVIDWVRSHPEETRRIIRDLGTRAAPTAPGER